MKNIEDKYLNIGCEDVEKDPNKYIGMDCFLSTVEEQDDWERRIFGVYNREIYYATVNDSSIYHSTRIRIKNPDYIEPKPEISDEDLHEKIMTMWMSFSEKRNNWGKVDMYFNGKYQWMIESNGSLRKKSESIEYFRDVEFRPFPPLEKN